MIGSESPQFDANPDTGSDRLLADTYQRLRKMARSRLARERSDHTLQATALVHEAWLRLGKAHQTPDDQAEFIAAMCVVMRRVLVDHARRRLSAKRGAGAFHEPFDDDVPSQDDSDSNPEEMIAVDEALIELEKEHPRAVSLVRLRYFTGLTIEEAAASLRISAATANRDWVFARDWIAERVRGAG